ncbi:MAG: hypothetical protein EPO32_06670 [Anaerolineae bacterium]|nr:MAG: hypothetical protein EPO32_06670 [Anaerolineae bacterium]
MLDLESLTERSFYFEQLFEYAYGVVWSPEETQIAVLLMNCPAWKIIVIDIPQEQVMEIVESSEGDVEECLYIDWYRAIYQPAMWLSNEELLLDIPNSESLPLVLNIVSGELQPVEE